MIVGDWQVDCREGMCSDPRLPRLPGVPFRMRRRSQPHTVFVIDNRHAGEQFTQGNCHVVLVTIWTTLDLLAGEHLVLEEAQKPAAVVDRDCGELRTQSAVCAVLSIGRTKLSALIRVLPPEDFGAARLTSGPNAAKKRRVWHADALEAWFDAAVNARANPKGQVSTSSERRTPAPAIRRPRDTDGASSLRDLVRGG